jgi:hypothetical protein
MDKARLATIPQTSIEGAIIWHCLTPLEITAPKGDVRTIDRIRGLSSVAALIWINLIWINVGDDVAGGGRGALGRGAVG